MIEKLREHIQSDNRSYRELSRMLGCQHNQLTRFVDGGELKAGLFLKILELYEYKVTPT